MVAIFNLRNLAFTRMLHSFGTTAVLEAIKSLTHVEKDCG